jgi:diadenosine tetraphosphate (Ap4A) HIT family hydrolase
MNCTKYKKIYNNLKNLRESINMKIECDNKNGAKDVSLKNSKIVNVDSTIKVFKFYDNRYNNTTSIIRPFLIDTSTFSEYAETTQLIRNMKTDVEEDCVLCKNYFFDGFEKQMDFTNSIVFGQKITPVENEMFLLYKNFVIINNLEPYFPEHLMILSQNHKPYSIPGSQYEILNLETISDVNNIIAILKKDFFAGSNYANTGSQHHFHIHLIKRQPQVYYGFANYITILNDHIFTYLPNYEEVGDGIFYKLKTIKHRHPTERELLDTSSKIESSVITLNNKKKKISLTKFEEQTFGYKGLLLSMQMKPDNVNISDNLEDLKEFNIIQRNILNYIEDSTTHTFTLFYPNTHLNNTFLLVIFCQKLDKKISFRDCCGFIDSYHYAYNEDFLKNQVYKHVDTDKLFTKKKMIELIQPVIYSEYNPFSDNQIRSIFKSTRIDRKGFQNIKLNKFFKEEIRNKKMNVNPKLIIINAPMASGKSLLVKNLDCIIKNYKKEEFVHINIDTILERNEKYKNEVKIISDFLKEKFYNKKIKDLNIENLPDYDFRISDLKNNTYLELLDHSHLKSIIDNINKVKVKKKNDKLVEDQNGVEILSYFYRLFNKFNVNSYRQNLFESICNFCFKNKLNVLIEVEKRTYFDLKRLFLDNNQNQNDFFNVYNKDNIYYISYDYNETDDNIKRFIYRNGLIRNILEGRVISSDDFEESLIHFKNIVRGTYRGIKNIYFKNLNNKLPVNFNVDTKFLNFDLYKDFNNEQENEQENQNLICLNYGEDIQDSNLQIKTFKNDQENENEQEMSIACFVKRNLKLKEDFPNEKYKSICNDYILKNLMIDSNITFLIKVLFDESKKIIDKVVPNYNNITNEDVKLVFKGGMNIRFYILEFQKIIINKLNLNNDNIVYKQLKELFKTINKTSFDDDFEIGDSLFSSIANKSDLDFVLLINNSKLTEYEYNRIKNELIGYFNMLLNRFGLYMDDTNFMYTDKITDKTEFCKKKGLNNIDKIKKKSYIVADENNIEIPNKENKSFIIFPKYIDENNTIENKYSSYYNYYMPNFTLPKRMKETDEISDDTIDILRLKAKFKLEFFENQFGIEESVDEKGDEKIIESDGEIIDIVFEDYSKESGLDKIQKIKFNDTLNDFEFNIFNLDYLIKDIIRMLSGRLFPWADKKYNKRLYRLFYLMIIKSTIDEKTNYFTGIANINNTEIEVDNILYGLKEMIDNTNSRVNMINSYDINDLKKLLNTLSINSDDIILRNFKDNMNAENELFIETVNKILEESGNIYENILKVLNNEIVLELEKKLSSEPVIAMWGGANYNLLKKQYLKMKGGGITFDIRNLRISGMNVRYESRADYRYVKEFFTNYIKNIKVNNENFDQNDIDNARFVGCGTFGCTILVPHNRTNKKFAFKVINDSNLISKRYKEIRETYYGYYLTQKKKSNINPFYAYFNANNLKYGPNNPIRRNRRDRIDNPVQKPYFSSINDDITYDGNNFDIPNNARNANIFIIMMEGGTDNIESLTQYLKLNYDTNILNNKIKCLDILSSLLVQSLNVYKLSTCYEVANKCVYFTHNDIKPDNSIFIDKGNDTFEFQYIDFGGGSFSKYFFTNEESFDLCVTFRELITDDLDITSPIIDLAMAINSIVLGCVSIKRTAPDFNRILNGYKAHLGTLKSNINNLIEYKQKLEEMHTFLINEIKNNLFGNNDTTDIEEELNDFINKLMILVNLAVHISNWLSINPNLFVNKGVFKDFTINLINMKNRSYKLVNYAFSKDDTNFELLEKIVIATSIQLNTI